MTLSRDLLNFGRVGAGKRRTEREKNRNLVYFEKKMGTEKILARDT